MACRKLTRRSGVAAAFALMLVAVPGAAPAQLGPWTAGSELNDQQPGWLRSWSPFQPMADLPRPPAAPPPAPDLLLLPATRVGLFWTAGNPGALPFEVDDANATFQLARTSVSGEYRRPLDPVVEEVSGVAGMGWRPLGDAGAGIARIVVAQLAQDPGSNATMLGHHASSPVFLTDSLIPEVSRANVHMEAAGGWRIGEWGLGVAAAYAAVDNRTRNTPVARAGRAVLPAAAGGVAYSFGPALRLGATARWLGTRETTTMVTEMEVMPAYVWRGYFEPQPVTVSPQSPLFRRAETDAWSAGIGAAGEWRDAVWTAFAARTGRNERHTLLRQNDPPHDRWTAEGHTAGAALARPVRERIRASVIAGWTGISGYAERADLDGVVFRGEESAANLAAEIRLEPAPGGWSAAAVALVSRERRLHRDVLAEFGTESVVWGPGGGLEVARTMTPRLGVAAAYSVVVHTGYVRAPGAAEQAEEFVRFIAPELAVDGSDRLAQRAGLTVRWETGPGTVVFAQGRWGRQAPLGDTMWPDISPAGSRSAWSANVGVRW